MWPTAQQQQQWHTSTQVESKGERVTSAQDGATTHRMPTLNHFAPVAAPPRPTLLTGNGGTRILGAVVVVVLLVHLPI